MQGLRQFNSLEQIPLKFRGIHHDRHPRIRKKDNKNVPIANCLATKNASIGSRYGFMSFAQAHQLLRADGGNAEQGNTGVTAFRGG